MKVNKLTAGICAVLLSQSVFADEARIETLEKQVEQLSQMVASSSSGSTLAVNGFASTGISKADNESGYAGVTDSVEFENESLFGVQGVFRPTSNVEAMLQLVAKGTDDDGDMNRDRWEPEVTWAYLGYQFEDGLKIRGGKLRLPLFMLSDYLDVTYAMPWARGPEEVYGRVIIDSFTGADAGYELEFEDSSLYLQGFYGNEKDVAVNGTSLDKLMGLSASWTDDILTLRASYTSAEINTPAYSFEHPVAGPITVAATSDTASFYSLGARYEDHGVQLLTEFTNTEIEGVYGDSMSGYVSTGYHFGSVTPYVMYSFVKTTDDNDHQVISQANTPRDRDAYSVGARWDIQPGLALKGDVTYAENNLSAEKRNSNELNGLDDTLVYTVKLDATF
ncbi:porin [Vibrio sp. RE86]|uniref:porin n=1 Tax=Vibrio sp. RE86 TaxID=2607605 RepID=UPI0014939B9C|nr:porin [Vibrio sp. RE86]NOH79452.1 porin [Vibrio sp. RE86]